MTDRTGGSDGMPQKSAYETPRLLVFGDLVELTQNVGSMAAVADGGVAPTHKTS